MSSTPNVSSKDNHFERGRLEFQNKNYTLSAERFWTAFQEQPLKQTIILIFFDNIVKACENDETKAKVLKLQGRCYSHQENYSKAIEKYKEALTMKAISNSFKAKLYMQLKTLYENAGDSENSMISDYLAGKFQQIETTNYTKLRES